MEYRFTVEGNPVAQSRPRFSTRSGYVRTYEERDITDYKNLIYAKASEVFIKNGCTMLNGALEVEIKVGRAIPKSISKKAVKDIQKGLLFPTQKPDLDNYVKAVLDGIGLKGMPPVIFRNDSQVVSIIAKKIFADNPNIEVTIREVR